MMPSLDTVRRQLDKDEPDYPRLARDLGSDALPQLELLIRENDPVIAPKATYAAALIGGPAAGRLVMLASASAHDVVRVAAAGAIPLLPDDEAESVGERLLADPDTGVRLRTAKSAVALGHPRLIDLMRVMAQHDSDAFVREFVARLAEPT